MYAGWRTGTKKIIYNFGYVGKQHILIVIILNLSRLHALFYLIGTYICDVYMH